MITVIGKPGCSRCAVTKNILDTKQINYIYSMFTDLSTEIQEKYMQMAQMSNLTAFPLIFKDDVLVTLQEI